MTLFDLLVAFMALDLLVLLFALAYGLGLEAGRED